MWSALGPWLLQSLWQLRTAACVGTFSFPFHPFGTDFTRILPFFQIKDANFRQSPQQSRCFTYPAFFVCGLFFFFITQNAPTDATTAIAIKHLSIYCVYCFPGVPSTSTHFSSLGFNRPCRWFRCTWKRMFPCVESGAQPQSSWFSESVMGSENLLF